MTREEAILEAIARGASAVADAKLRYPGALGDVLATSIRAQTQATVRELMARAPSPKMEVTP